MKAIVKQQQPGSSRRHRCQSRRIPRPLPVLANILIQTDNGRLKLSATNLSWNQRLLGAKSRAHRPLPHFRRPGKAPAQRRSALTADLRTQSLNVRRGDAEH